MLQGVWLQNASSSTLEVGPLMLTVALAGNNATRPVANAAATSSSSTVNAIISGTLRCLILHSLETQFVHLMGERLIVHCAWVWCLAVEKSRGDRQELRRTRHAIPHLCRFLNSLAPGHDLRELLDRKSTRL